MALQHDGADLPMAAIKCLRTGRRRVLGQTRAVVNFVEFTLAESKRRIGFR